MSLRFYNTLTQKLEEFTPLHDNVVRMYTCGPTVYSRAHIGNFPFSQRTRSTPVQVGAAVGVPTTPGGSCTTTSLGSQVGSMVPNGLGSNFSFIKVVRSGWAPDATLAHFVHIPWPQPDYWRVLPEDIRRAAAVSMARCFIPRSQRTPAKSIITAM